MKLLEILVYSDYCKALSDRDILSCLDFYCYPARVTVAFCDGRGGGIHTMFIARSGIPSPAEHFAGIDK